MRRDKVFPGPGDRIRLAVPLPTDESGPRARFGTVLERSCGRSDALRVRWDDTAGRPGLAPDAGTVGWLADAGWYWDRAHLQVVDGRTVTPPVTPITAPARQAATEEDTWLSTGLGARGGRSASGVDGSMDAIKEWEAALASEVDAGPDTTWEQLLADALGNGLPAVPSERAFPAPGPSPEFRPPPVAAPAKAWTGDDILPRPGSGGKRWGRR